MESQQKRPLGSIIIQILIAVLTALAGVFTGCRMA